MEIDQTPITNYNNLESLHNVHNVTRTRGEKTDENARIEDALTHRMRSMMLMMHSMMMMMSLLLSVMLGMMLAAPVRWISVIKDEVEARLASPDLGHLALGHLYLPVVRRQMAWHRQLGRAIVVHLSCRVVPARRFLVVLRRVLQREIVLVQIDRERDTMTGGQHFHVRADRCHRGRWIQLHQGRLQFQGIHRVVITSLKLVNLFETIFFSNARVRIDPSSTLYRTIIQFPDLSAR